MNIAIMQPYFLPYIGYFQLIAASDIFVVYDNIKYTKKGWINRNRFLQNGTDALFSIPLKKGSDACHVIAREVMADFDRRKILSQLHAAYQRAPYFAQTMPLIETILLYPDTNLFRYIHHSIVQICQHLDIKTEIRISSTIPIDHTLCSQEKVLAICQSLHANRYINPIGGVDLYSRDAFQAQGISLHFLKTRLIQYPQFSHDFVPWLSIIDIMMFNAPPTISHYLNSEFDLV